MKNIANYYIGMLVLYYAQGAFYTSGSLLSRMLLVLILIISGYYFFYANNRYALPRPLKIMSCLLLIFTIYGLIPILGGVGDIIRAISPFQYVKFILLSQLPIYAFYVFWKKEWINEKMIRLWFFVFLVIAIAGFNYRNSQFLIEAELLGKSAEEFTNNQGYIILTLMCLLPFFHSKPFIQYSLLAVIMAYVVMGFKRGAIFSSALCLIWFLIQTFKMDKNNSLKYYSRQIFRVFLVVGLTIFLVYEIQYLLNSSDYFNYRLDRTMDGDSSNRDVIYAVLFNHFINETSVFKLLFGNGAYGTVEIIGTGAHNDWLEIAIDNGMVSVILYLAYWIAMFSMFFKGDRKSMATTIMGLFVIIYFMKTLFSMSYNTVTPYAACAIAYAMVNYKKKPGIQQKI